MSVDSKQMDMFSLSKKPHEKYLHIVHNGKVSDKSYIEFFDSDKYDTLGAVTFVSSPSFFSKIVKDYKIVKIIIGIDNADLNKAFADSVSEHLNVKGADFFKGLDDYSKERIVEDKIEIRYSEIGILIHSKIYLLSNSKSYDKRVIIGSANFTESAFNNDIKQYEEIIVFDDDANFEMYSNRFTAILKDTVDYIPQRAKDKFKAEKAYYIDDEERAETIIDQLTKRGGTIVMPEEIVEGIQISADANERENVEYQVTTKIINQITRKKDNKLIFKSKAELLKAKSIIKEITFRSTKAAQELTRFCLTYNEYERRIDYQKLYDEGVIKSESFCKVATAEQIRSGLESIDKFIKAYNLFTTNPDENNLSKIYEVILYSFMSVFLFKVREDYGMDVGKLEKREDIPVFLIVGGRAKSGKSSLLTFISKLLGNDSSTDYLQYKDIDKRNTIEGLFNEQNVFPILVDEMAENFFKSSAKSKGEIFIKHIANSLDGKHPVLITTTNTSRFNVPEQVLRRVYYIQIDKTFDDTRKVEADTYFFDVIRQVTNDLFMDFCNRVCERIMSGKKIYQDSSDCLWYARNIFREYYKEADVTLPDYFPNRPFDDYKVRGKNMWRTLLNENSEIFRYNQEANILTVSLKDVMSEDEVQSYMNYIDVACIKEDMGIHVLLNSTMFFKWLDIKNPYIKKSFWLFWKK
jgi:hypothetical protein